MVLRRRTIRAGKLLAVVLGISFATPVRAAEDDTPACRFQLPVVEQNEKYLSQLGSLTLFKDCKTEGSYLYYHHWYSSKMPARRYWARGLAVFVILLGAVLPVVVNWRKTEAHYKVAVSLIGALIVIRSGHRADVRLRGVMEKHHVGAHETRGRSGRLAARDDQGIP
jgi:hypothetical protein